MLDHLEQLRVLAPEVLAEVLARFDGVFLIFAVDDLAHALDEQAVLVFREQRIPVLAPQHLDDIPAGAAEHRLELLNDLPVAAHRAVEPLQVAVDDEDEVVELLAGGQRDGAERFGLVGLAVSEKRPHFRVRRLLQPAVFQVADEPRLVNRHDRAEPHRHRRIFPEIRHQPRMRIRGQPAARRELAPEIVELFFGEPPFEERPRINARRRVTLVIHDIAIARAAGSEEMIEADFVQRRRRRERRDMSADAGLVLVCAQHHRDRVPADEALDAALDLLAAGKRHFLIGRQRVDVRRVRGERKPDAATARVLAELHAAAGPLARGRWIAGRSRANPATRWFQSTRDRRRYRRRYFS